MGPRQAQAIKVFLLRALTLEEILQRNRGASIVSGRRQAIRGLPAEGLDPGRDYRTKPKVKNI